MQRAKVGVWPEDVETSEMSDGKITLNVLTPGGSRMEDGACRESIAPFMDRAYPVPNSGEHNYLLGTSLCRNFGPLASCNGHAGGIGFGLWACLRA